MDNEYIIIDGIRYWHYDYTNEADLERTVARYAGDVFYIGESIDPVYVPRDVS